MIVWVQKIHVDCLGNDGEQILSIIKIDTSNKFVQNYNFHVFYNIGSIKEEQNYNFYFLYNIGSPKEDMTDTSERDTKIENIWVNDSS